MESRLRVLFLIVVTVGMTGCAATKNLFGGDPDEAPLPSSNEPGQVIDPAVERRDVAEPAIDREDFEIGAFVGLMSVEDFGADVVYGARLAYHVSEDIFVEATVGRTEAGLTSFEALSGGARLITDSERTLTYYNLSLGYNVLPGEVFIGKGRAYNTALYIIGGLGSTRFAGDDRFTVNLGAGYRLLLTDAVALHFGIRDHLFDIDLLGEDKTAHNLEGHIGLTVFF